MLAMSTASPFVACSTPSFHPEVPPKYLSSDNDPLSRYHQWQANLRILGADEVKTVPYTPLSHPFVERLIGTIRREFLDHTLFRNATDLERKLETFRQYYNNIVCTLHLMAIHPRKSPAKPSFAVLISTIFSGNLIATNYFSCLLPPEYQFAMHTP